MSWSPLILVISVCLIQSMSGCLDCRLTPCEQCRVLAISVLNGGGEIVELTCRVDYRDYQQFCSEIRGKEAEFVNTVQEYKKSGKRDLSSLEMCSSYSVCNPSF